MPDHALAIITQKELIDPPSPFSVSTLPFPPPLQIGGAYLAVYLWGFMLGLSLFFMTIYPTVIAPLFNKFEPLPEVLGVKRPFSRDMSHPISHFISHPRPSDHRAASVPRSRPLPAGSSSRSASSSRSTGQRGPHTATPTCERAREGRQCGID